MTCKIETNNFPPTCGRSEESACVQYDGLPSNKCYERISSKNQINHLQMKVSSSSSKVPLQTSTTTCHDDARCSTNCSVLESHQNSRRLPAEVMMEHVVRYLDRSSYNNVSLMDKEFQQKLRIASGVAFDETCCTSDGQSTAVDEDRVILSPPWPNDMSVDVDDTGAVLVCDFTPIHGTLLACGTNKGSLYVWNKMTGTRTKVPTNLRHKQQLSSSQGHYFVPSTTGSRNMAIQMLKFSPNGQYLVTTGSCRRGDIDVWDVPRLYDCESSSHSAALPPLDGRNPRTFSGHSVRVHSVVFTKDSKIMISVSFDGTIRYWNLENGRCMHVQSFLLPRTGASCNLLTMALSISEASNELKTFPRNKTEISRKYCSKCHSLLSRTGNMTVRICYVDIDAPSMAHVQALSSSSCSCSVAPCSSSSIMVPSDGDRSLVGESMKMIRSIAFSPNGKYLITADIGSTMRCWKLDDTVSGRSSSHRCAKKLQPVLMWESFCPGGVHDIAVFNNKKMSHDCGVNDGQDHQSKRGLQTIATGGDEGTVRLWNAKDGRMVTSDDSDANKAGGSHEDVLKFCCTSSPSAIRTIAVCPSSQHGCTTLASGSLDGSIRIWNA